MPKRVARRQSVAEGIQQRNWIRQIKGGISVQAIQEYLHLWTAIDDVQLNDDEDKTV